MSVTLKSGECAGKETAGENGKIFVTIVQNRSKESLMPIIHKGKSVPHFGKNLQVKRKVACLLN